MATENVQALQDEPTIEMIEQDKFYSDRLGLIFTLIAMLAVAALMMVVLLIKLQFLRSPSPTFFNATASAQLIQEVPLDQPSMSANLLFNWLVESMIVVHSFNFVNYGTKIEAAREYFTSEGYDSFSRALQDAQIMDNVINKKYVFRGLPSAAPQIIKEGILANHYLWKIKLPMILQYRNSTEILADNADIILLIVRVPTTQSAYGIKILKYELSIRKPG